MGHDIDFTLTLAEHDWSEEQLEDLREAKHEALRRIGEGFRRAGPDEAEALEVPEAQLTSVDAYMALVEKQLEELFGDVLPDVKHALRLRLEVLLNDEKADLTAGWAVPFEGNHCDTTFHVRLRPR